MGVEFGNFTQRQKYQRLCASIGVNFGIVCNFTGSTILTKISNIIKLQLDARSLLFTYDF